MTPTDDLLSCPHCGESLVLKGDHHGEWWGHKNDVGSCIHAVTQLMDAEDFAAWNRRAPQPAERRAPDAVAMAEQPAGYRRKEDIGRSGSYWVSTIKNGYYTEPVYSHPSVPEDRRAVAQAETVAEPVAALDETGNCFAIRGGPAIKALFDAMPKPLVGKKLLSLYATPITPSPSPPDEVRELCERFRSQVSIALKYASDEKRPDERALPSVFELQVGHLRDIGEELTDRLVAISAERDRLVAVIDLLHGPLSVAALTARAEAAEARAEEAERQMEVLQVEHNKVLAAIHPRLLNPMPDGGGAWHYELVDAAALAPLPEKDKG